MEVWTLTLNFRTIPPQLFLNLDFDTLTIKNLRESYLQYLKAGLFEVHNKTPTCNFWYKLYLNRSRAWSWEMSEINGISSVQLQQLLNRLPSFLCEISLFNSVNLIFWIYQAPERPHSPILQIQILELMERIIFWSKLGLVYSIVPKTFSCFNLFLKTSYLKSLTKSVLKNLC